MVPVLFEGHGFDWAMCRTHRRNFPTDVRWQSQCCSCFPSSVQWVTRSQRLNKACRVSHNQIRTRDSDVFHLIAEAGGSRSVVNSTGSLITKTDFYLTQELLPIISVEFGQLSWFLWGSFVFSFIKCKVPPSCSHLDSLRQCQSPRDTQHTWMDYLLYHCYEYQHAVFWLLSGCVQTSS